MVMLENERVGGPRQYTGADSLGTLRVWKCPACGQDNQTPFAEGCPQCGNGKPGEHKGIDPVVTPEERARILSQQMAAQGGSPRHIGETRAKSPGLPVDFDGWYATQPIRVNIAMREWLQRAFDGGWQAALRSLVRENAVLELEELLPADPIDENRPGDPVEEAPETPQFPPEQIRQRTLLAALRSFRDTILPDAQEEVTTREWLGLAEVEQWIAEIEKELTQ